jgi:hypothetical protein
MEQVQLGENKIVKEKHTKSNVGVFLKILEEKLTSVTPIIMLLIKDLNVVTVQACL